MTDRWFTRAFGAHYPLLYSHRDTAEAARCLDQLPRLAPLVAGGGRRVLDLGCGDGRHLELLTGQGHDVVGLDLSAELLERARVRFPEKFPARLVRGDMRRLPFAETSLDTVLSLFTAFGYFGPPAANQDPVREVARVLKPGGHWFLDYFDGDRVREELAGKEPLFREREMGPLLVREERRFLEDASQVVKQVRLAARPGFLKEAYELGVDRDGLEYTEKVAVFSLTEIDGMAAAEGLARVGAAGGYEGQTLGEGSRWILVYRKPAKGVVI